MRLGELLIEAGAITDAQLQAALRQQGAAGGRLGSNLIELGFLTEATLSKVLAAQLRLPRVSEAALDKLPRNVLDLISVVLAGRHSMCPVRLDGTRLHVAMSDPLDKVAIAAVAAHTSLEIRPMVAPDGVVRHALQKHYGISPKVKAIQLRSEAAMRILRHGEDPHETVVAPAGPAPVFNPYVALSSDVQTVALDDHVAAKPKSPPPPPVAARAPETPAAGGATLGESLVAVQSIDDVGELIVAFVHTHFARSVLLLVRGENLVGWRVHGAGASVAAVRTFTVPLSALPALSHVLTEGTPVISRDASLVLPFVALLGDPAGTPTLILPLRHRGRPAAFVAATGGRGDVERRVAEFSRFGAKIDLGFQLVMLRQQILA